MKCWIWVFYCASVLVAAPADFPIVAEDLQVKLFAREPLVRNPCAITFDAKGRLCVGMGPQYRNPTPDTPGDSVWILLDKNHDGVADNRKRFATGFNNIQGLAWKDGALWVANAPDLTVVRDTDGDEVADEYVRIYTDLGNLEHGLHGLNWAPDGKLYMSKGNSKGLTVLPDRVAPKAFRDLWGVQAPSAPDFPEPKIYNTANYEKTYHDPRDDWGLTGGILRCDGDGKNLEIVSRGFRNPWDICFDDTFTWFGTDNDQSHGDKLFSPFLGAHFGWGHAWSYDWKGDEHLPTAPSAGPLFEGSGAGTIHLNHPTWPMAYRDVFIYNDWLNRETLVYRKSWKGAWLQAGGKPEVIAHAGGGRAMSQSRGRSFDPVDIEVGPDGALWISSWGREYGAKMVEGQQQNEGRIYRLWPKKMNAEWRPEPKRAKPLKDWSVPELMADLDSGLPVWRVNASEELVRRDDKMVGQMQYALRDHIKKSERFETWAGWTLGRLQPHNLRLTALFTAAVRDSKSLNFRRQAAAIVAMRLQQEDRLNLPDTIRLALEDPEPRQRHAAVLALREAGSAQDIEHLLAVLAKETDRVVYYSAWGALGELLTVPQRQRLLSDKRAGVRRGVVLSLLEEDALTDAELKPLMKDTDAALVDLVKRRLGGKDAFPHRGRPLEATLAGRTAREAAVNPVTNLLPASGRPYRVMTLEAGVHAYTDRNYRVTGVPEVLRGEAFIQPACGDAERDSGVALEFTLRYPATVWLADDARAKVLPKWMRQGWTRTELTIESTDPKRMHLYRRDFPAGPVKLGANRDGVSQGKGNYLVIVQPKLLAPTGKVAAVDEVLKRMDQADATRGRDLFLSRHGANCTSCHQLEGVGNVFAPGLADIGDRTDAEFLARSILEPNAAITEGFAMQVFTQHDDSAVAGIVLEETGREVKVATAGGVVLRVAKAQVAKRETLKQSAMPAAFGAMLQPQQVADVVAYLLQQKAKPSGFHLETQKDQVALWLDGKKIGTYLLKHPQLTRQAWINMKTHTGLQVTRNYPPQASDGADHPLMHPGIWMGFGHLDGQDYWRLQAKVLHDGFVQPPKVGPNHASITVRNRYQTADGKGEVSQEICRMEFRRHADGILLLWDSTFRNEQRDFYFGDQEESGLAVRMASPLRVKGGNGTIINHRGEKNGAGIWGKESKWFDYAGQIKGRHVGLLVAAHPDNPRPSWLHARDYGVVVTNPFPKQPKERREPYVKTWVKKGEPFRLRYAVLIHDTAQPIDPALAYQSMLQALKTTRN